MQIIALNGYAGSGKSAVADYLVNQLGYTRLKFADTFKAGLEAMWLDMGFSEAEVAEMQDGKLKDCKLEALMDVAPRDWQIHMGESFRHRFGADIWCVIMLTKLAAVANRGVTKVVIDDLRKDLEREAIAPLGAKVWRITRPGIGPKNNHDTEHLVPDPDFWINNDGALWQLYKSVDDLAGLEAAA